MKLRFNGPSALAGLAVGALLAGGVVWAGGSIDSSGEQVCRTKAGYLRISSTGECRRSEVPVELPQGPQGEPGIQGEPGVDGRDGSDASVDSLRCFLPFVQGVDLSGCQLPESRFETDPPNIAGLAWNLEDADLSGARIVPAKSSQVLKIVTGGHNTCALFASGDVKCIGDDLLSPTTALARLQGSLIDVSAGWNQACVITKTHLAYCWGSDEYGKSTVPPDLGKVKQMAPGYYHTCAVTEDNFLRCWGGNDHHQMRPPSDLGKVLSVSTSGDFHTCAVTMERLVRCWGDAEYGQSNVPADLGEVLSITTGDIHTCALRIDHTVRCWGGDVHGQVSGPNQQTDVIEVGAGYYHTCLLYRNQSLRCFGNGEGNYAGQADVPADLGKVAGLWMSSGWHTCVLLQSGQPRCWGENLYRQSTVDNFWSVGTRLKLNGANLAGADLSSFRGIVSGCNIVGHPLSLPSGYAIVDSCLVPTGTSAG